VHISFVGKEDVTMSAKYDKDVKAKAIRLVRMCKIGSIPQLKPRAQNRLGSWPGRGMQ
jgi:hypothetical protein